MKWTKVPGLFVGVMALVAFAGGSTASATVLCATTPTEGSPPTAGTTCPEGWAYPAKTTIHAVNTGITSFHSTFKTLECKKSTIALTTENEGSATETVQLSVEAITYEECNCENKVLKKGTMEIHWIPGTFNGTLTANGEEYTVTCSTIFGNVHCIYVTINKDLGEITGSATHTSAAILHTNVNIERTPTNGLCNEESLVTTTYEITSPKPLWVAGHT